MRALQVKRPLAVRRAKVKNPSREMPNLPELFITLENRQREREKETHRTMGNWVLDRNSREEKMSIKTGHFLGMNKEQLLPDMR